MCAKTVQLVSRNKMATLAIALWGTVVSIVRLTLMNVHQTPATRMDSAEMASTNTCVIVMLDTQVPTAKSILMTVNPGGFLSSVL